MSVLVVGLFHGGGIDLPRLGFGGACNMLV